MNINWAALADRVRLDAESATSTQSPAFAAADLAVRAASILRAGRRSDQPQHSDALVEAAVALLRDALAVLDRPVGTPGAVIDDGPDRHAGGDQNADLLAADFGEPQPPNRRDGQIEDFVDMVSAAFLDGEAGRSVVQDKAHGLAPSRSGEGSVGAPRRGSGDLRAEGDTTGGVR